MLYVYGTCNSAPGASNGAPVQNILLCIQGTCNGAPGTSSGAHMNIINCNIVLGTFCLFIITLMIKVYQWSEQEAISFLLYPDSYETVWYRNDQDHKGVRCNSVALTVRYPWKTSKYLLYLLNDKVFKQRIWYLHIYIISIHNVYTVRQCFVRSKNNYCKHE